MEFADHPPAPAPFDDPRRIRSLVSDLDGIVWEADARTMLFSFVSDGVAKILGYSPAAWLESPTFWADHLHPDDRERSIAQFIRAASAGWSFDTEYRLVASDGRVLWFHDVGHVVKDADGRPTLVRGLMVDITNRKAVEQERIEATERFRRVVERLPAIIYIRSAEEDGSEDLAPGAVLYVSPQVESILGVTPREWMSDPDAWSRQFHEGDRDLVRRQRARAVVRGEPLTAQYRMIAKDGTVVWFHDEAVLVRDEVGKPLFWQGIMYDITRQRTSEERAQDTETRYRALVDHIPAIVYSMSVVGDRLQPVYINPRVKEILDVTPEEWLAEPVGTWLDSVHEEDRGLVREEKELAQRTGEPFSAEYRMVAKDGTVVWFRDEAALVRDEEGEPRYWQGVMTDITARKEAEAQLAEAEARYRALVEHTPTITYIDPFEGSTAMYISPQTTSMLGYTPQEWRDDPDLFQKIIHPEDRERAERAPASVGIHDATYRALAKDGRVVWLHDQARLITDEDGKPKYWQGVLVDITQHKRAEELERDLALERDTARRLRAIDDMKNTFLQAVSHDLRTPLAAILGLAVTLSREDIDISVGEYRDMASRIAHNARKLDRLVTDLLDLDRLSRGIVEPSFHPTDLGRLVRKLLDGTELTGGRRVELDAPPIVIPIDAAKVERIVENLVGNTVKHTPAESSIWVRVERYQDGALIVVDDDGPGVPADTRERIFEPFLQGDSASPSASGVGVGLALVARFAELHDGAAWVEERPGGGASFRVFLPAHPAGYVPETADGSEGEPGAV